MLPLGPFWLFHEWRSVLDATAMSRLLQPQGLLKTMVDTDPGAPVPEVGSNMSGSFEG